MLGLPAPYRTPWQYTLQIWTCHPTFYIGHMLSLFIEQTPPKLSMHTAHYICNVQAQYMSGFNVQNCLLTSCEKNKLNGGFCPWLRPCSVTFFGQVNSTRWTL